MVSRTRRSRACGGARNGARWCLQRSKEFQQWNSRQQSTNLGELKGIEAQESDVEFERASHESGVQEITETSPKAQKSAHREEKKKDC